MNEFHQDIHQLGRVDPAPLESVEAATDATAREAAWSRVVARTTSGPAKPQRRRTTLRMAALAAAGACALLIVGLVRGGSDDTGGGSFGAFAAVAAEQPADGIIAVSWESRLLYDRPEYWAQGAQYPDQVEESTEVSLWIGDGVRFEENTREFWDREKQLNTSGFLTDGPADLVCWGGYEPHPETVCARTGIVDEFGDPAERLDLPLDPTELRTALEDRANAEPDPPARLEPCGLEG